MIDIKVSTVKEIRDSIENLSSKLTISRKKFCDIWLMNNQNATQAYLAVFKTNNPATAAVGASRLMRRPDVKAYLDLMRHYSSEEILSHMSVTRERILDEEAKIAFIDVRKMFDTEGEFLPPSMWPEEVSRCISGFDVDQRWDAASSKWRYKYKIKLNDKGRALGRLESVLGMNKAESLHDDDRNLFQSFLESVDGKTRGRLPSEYEDDEE